MKNNLDNEEQDILEKFENNELEKPSNAKDEIKIAKNAAKATMLKSKHISIIRKGFTQTKS